MLGWTVVVSRPALILMLGLALIPPVQADPLPLAPGQDPGGVAIAVVAPAVELTDTALLQRIARDGEGVAIGWDFSKSTADDASGKTTSGSDQELDVTRAGVTSTLQALGASTDFRLVPVWFNPSHAETLGRAIAFVAKTPATLALVPFSSCEKSDWAAFEAAARHFSQLLFLAAAEATNSPPCQGQTYPDALRLSNVISVGASGQENADVVIAPATGEHAQDPALAVALRVFSSCVLQAHRSGTALDKTRALQFFETYVAETATGESSGTQAATTHCSGAR